MQKLWNDVEESYKQVKLAEESVVTATENVRLNTNYYQAGTTTLSDLLDSQLLLQQSRNQYTDAYTQHLIKQTQYLQATGRQ
jgi:outer membrane protein